MALVTYIHVHTRGLHATRLVASLPTRQPELYGASVSKVAGGNYVAALVALALFPLLPQCGLSQRCLLVSWKTLASRTYQCIRVHVCASLIPRGVCGLGTRLMYVHDVL